MAEAESVARTRLFLSDKTGLNRFNGKVIEEDTSGRSPASLINLYENKIKSKFHTNNIYFESRNENILSGSSDAGAAALGKCIEFLLPGEDKFLLENNLRRISESVGRSIFGGLTVTEVSNNLTKTTNILNAEKFIGFTILAFTFQHERKPSDEIHFNIKKLNEYPE
ncbi:mevalonate pyrophosphate decarboxylase, partial [mine drainage metagenome]